MQSASNGRRPQGRVAAGGEIVAPSARGAARPTGGIIARVWFERDALKVARALIGCLIVHELGGARRVARVVETEAYRGPRDLACHARAGLTRRTRSLLGEHGHAYVFFVYGMHHCFNVTCLGAGTGHAVLIRAAEPVEGIEWGVSMSGPGRFARAMGIGRQLDGCDLTRPPLYLCARLGRPNIGASPRVGVGYAGQWAERPWRFFDRRSPCVSRPPPASVGYRRGG